MHRPWPVLVLLLALTAPAGAATSLTELYQSVPPPPADVGSALAWVQGGKVAAPEIVALETHLRAAHATSLAASAQAATPADTGASASTAIAAAVAGYRGYASTHQGAQSPAAALGKRVQWLAKRFSGLHRRVAGTDRAAEVRTQELAAYRALFGDWQAQRLPLLSQAQRELGAAGDPAAMTSAEDRAAIQRYRAAMLNEVEVLLGLTRYAVERAAGLPAAEPERIEPSGNTLWDLMSDPRQRPPS